MIDLKGAIGIRSALSLEDYHNLPPKSAHFLMAAAENCEKAQYDDEHPKPQTKPQARGHLIHTGIEVDSEEDLLKFYGINPPHLHGNYLRTNAGKAEMKEFKDECQQVGKIAIKEEEFDMPVDDGPFPLSEINNYETEALIGEIYRKDFLNFGFAPWEG